MIPDLSERIREGDRRALARAISLVENEHPGYIELLKTLPARTSPMVIGLTGPPGAGKSTLVDALIGQLLQQQHKVGVLCVDPSSFFHHGAILGDRIRMREWYDHPDVFIRSLASRGSIGGLHPGIIEITDLLKAAGFDFILIETVGVGQNEVEIAALADTVVVVLVPEAGDTVQTMKAGLMEIADIFVVNKSDRPDAARFASDLRSMVRSADQPEIPVLQTTGIEKKGVRELLHQLEKERQSHRNDQRKALLLTEKACHLIASRQIRSIDRNKLLSDILDSLRKDDFNLYRIIARY